MNGNDYLIIEEEHAEQIEQDYIQSIREGTDEVPHSFKTAWLELYLQGDE